MHRGIRFPNRQARDAAVEAATNADIIGFNTIEKNAGTLPKKYSQRTELIPNTILKPISAAFLCFRSRRSLRRFYAAERFC
jgi:phosphosulfolactate synthase (CoM biosynthesis protein A)